MRAGRLATRRYKVRRQKMGWLLLIAGISLGFGASAYLRFLQPLPQTHISVQPAPTLPPEETQADERTIALAGQSWYALQIGVFDDAKVAGQKAEGYRARGAGGYIFRKDGCRLLAAAYTARADAQAVMSRLKTRHGLSTEIVEIVSPEITLRLSGQKGQLTALTDAFSAMEKLCGHLYQLSLSLDRQETEAAEALTALQSERDTLSVLSARLQSRFGASAPAAVLGLKQILDDCVQSLTAASAAKTLTQLGAQVKYCHLECICRMAAYASGLTN